jgi:hypothetical protein
MVRWFVVCTLLLVGSFSVVGCGSSTEPVVLPTTAQTEEEKQAAEEYSKMLENKQKQEYGSGN